MAPLRIVWPLPRIRATFCIGVSSGLPLMLLLQGQRR
jgi:hypothetical protein